MLDPVTGLPSGILDTMRIQQIPLTSQPIPTYEWGGLGRLQNPYYPDDIPTVFSVAHAKNQTDPLHSQAMTTDGQGNLNVRSVGGGGGGGTSPLPVIYRSQTNLFGAGPLVIPLSEALFIYGCQLCAWTVHAPPSGAPYFSAELRLSPDRDADMTTVFLANGSTAAIGVNGCCMQDRVQFDPPIDTALSWPRSADLSIFVDGNYDSASLSIIYGPG